MNLNEKYYNELKEILQKEELYKTQENLYHYTDINGLLGIIDKNELWLSERSYLNDVNDEEFIKSYINNYFHGTNELIRLEKFFFPKQNQYIFSTSMEYDSIHQWVYYGKKDSFCIEFCYEKLIDYFNKFNGKENIYHGSVLYENDIIYEIMEKIIREYNLAVPDKYNLLSGSFSDEDRNKLSFFYNYFYSMIKQKGHCCENEYRFVLINNKSPKFRVKNGLLVPYIEVNNPEVNNPIDKTKTKNENLPISKIVIGPNINNNNLQENIEYFLDKKGYSNVKVEKSKMKIR